jgi:hypothetical protein
MENKEKKAYQAPELTRRECILDVTGDPVPGGVTSGSPSPTPITGPG